MEKLTIKHIARRLCYDLKMYCAEKNEPIFVLEAYNVDYAIESSYHPILRPLSDLTKEITQKGETFVPIEWFELGDGENDSLEYDYGNCKLIKSLESLAKNGLLNDVNYLPFGVIEKLLEWHFVLDEPEGTWIDVNTLTENPYK